MITSCTSSLICRLICYPFQLRSDYDFYLCGKELPGFKQLAKEDQEAVLKHLP